ncbi:MAG: hypothetical protein ABUK06_04075, partial [Dehalococcoidales bacterium]
MNNHSAPEKAAPEPVLDPARQQQASQYARLKRRLSLAELLIGAGLLAALLISGLSDNLTGLFNMSTVPAAALYFIGLVVAYQLL